MLYNCRHTGLIVTAQKGRPLDATAFQSPASQSLANNLGWSPDYLANEDLEAERLFDYGALAPKSGPDADLQLVTCADARIAGPGSPVVYGVTPARAGSNQGHNKRVLFVPQVRKCS